MTAQHQRTALVGHTGFVGSNVARQHHFSDLYNTANINEIKGREFDLVVSAGGRADSHRINQAPDVDRAELLEYAELLSTASIAKLVHVSTVCVFDATDPCDEDTSTDPDDLTPYGRNRLELERTLANRFDTVRLRLPQLFGPGIKKGLVYDLANRYRLAYIPPDGTFQYYDLTRLWSDIEIVLRAGISVLNLATAPVGHRRLANDVFGIELDGIELIAETQVPPTYTQNMITKHAELFGEPDVYIMSVDDELDAIRRFVNSEFGDDETNLRTPDTSSTGAP